MAKKIPISSRLRIAGNEEETLHAAKDWLSENGKSIVLGLAIAVASIGGWKGWQIHHHNHFNQAAELYLAYIEDMDPHTKHLSNLALDYIDTPYPALAYLQRAAIHIENNAPEEAKEDLQWVSDNAVERSVAIIARIRYARVLLDQKEYARVIDYLNTVDYGISANTIVAEIRGDALAGSGNKEAAAKSYKTALNSTLSPAFKDLLLLKLRRVSQ